MDSVGDNFWSSGPTHLTYINWECVHYRRSVAASLVQGVYVLERERREKRQKHEPWAPAWWKFFHFELRERLFDTNLSIYGAIFEFRHPYFINNPSMANAPKYVIAFRGTMKLKCCFDVRDMQLNLSVTLNRLNRKNRFQIALETFRNLSDHVGIHNIWLAGHSLGSSIATLVGKNMAMEGKLVEAFLFNPPFASAPIEQIENEKIKAGLRFGKSVVTAVLTMIMKGDHEKSEETFAVLASWVPNLFVHPSDIICCEYRGYFQQRENMEKIGAGGIERLATQNSIRSLILSAFRKESYPAHLLPSADLIVNLEASHDFISAHKISQWWKPYLYAQCKQYRYS